MHGPRLYLLKREGLVYDGAARYSLHEVLRNRYHVLADVHKWLAYALIPLIAIHMGAALWHHFVERDATLKKMLPASGD